MDKGIRITSAFEMLGQYLSVVFKISGFGADSLDSDELAIWYGLNTLSGVRRRVVQIIMGIGGFAIHFSVEIPIIIYVYPGVQKWDTRLILSLLEGADGATMHGQLRFFRTFCM